MEIELSGATKSWGVNYEGKEYSVVETYDVNSDSYATSIIDLETNKVLSGKESVYEIIIEGIKAWEAEREAC